MWFSHIPKEGVTLTSTSAFWDPVLYVFMGWQKDAQMVPTGTAKIIKNRQKTKKGGPKRPLKVGTSKNIENEMNVAADLLEFELAARLRDELKELRKEISEFVE